MTKKTLPEIRKKFTPQEIKAILKRDGYQCTFCGLGKASGVDLHVEYFRPDDEAAIINGVTVCSKHTSEDKTESGKRMFIRLLERAKEINDAEMINFCTEALDVYEKNNVDEYIKWS